MPGVCHSQCIFFETNISQCQSLDSEAGQDSMSTCLNNTQVRQPINRPGDNDLFMHSTKLKIASQNCFYIRGF